jgi:methylenetetrahydrofolate reductase (NADPH)
MCGAHLPASLLGSLDKYAANDEACADFGIEYATRQCQELLRGGVPGLHFYTLNKARSTVQVVRNLSLDVERRSSAPTE